MGNAVIATNTDIMSNDINELESTLHRISDELDRMFEQIMDLDRMWEGPANETFVAAFSEDMQYCTELKETVRSIIESMRNAKDEYNRCETEVGSAVASIRI